MRRSAAEILREYGPFSGSDGVHGVTYDGQHVWFATGDRLNALDPASGETVRSIEVAAHAGTAFDGRHLFQLAEDRIQRIDPETGRVLATIPAPGGGGDSGLAWAEGTLWVGRGGGPGPPPPATSARPSASTTATATATGCSTPGSARCSSASPSCAR